MHSRGRTGRIVGLVHQPVLRNAGVGRRVRLRNLRHHRAAAFAVVSGLWLRGRHRFLRGGRSSNAFVAAAFLARRGCGRVRFSRCRRWWGRRLVTTAATLLAPRGRYFTWNHQGSRSLRAVTATLLAARSGDLLRRSGGTPATTFLTGRGGGEFVSRSRRSRPRERGGSTASFLAGGIA
jgi:hypothetical protein